MILILITTLVLNLFPGSRLSAELVWKYEKVALKAQPGQETLRLNFLVKNTGASPLRVLSAKASCDCLHVITPLPLLVPPDSEALLDLSYDARNREGSQTVRLQVATDRIEGGKLSVQQTTLRVHLELTPQVSVLPALLLWQERREAQSVEIKIHDPLWQPDPQPKLQGAYRAVLDQGKDPGVWYLRITPDKTGASEGWAELTFRKSKDQILTKKIRLISNLK
ncbi:MAG: DUF1573 domain-containing protein [Blastochloris sp.]|nr:DUF1573 domain-containing protein [Blastochloris sp.]